MPSTSPDGVHFMVGSMTGAHHAAVTATQSVGKRQSFKLLEKALPLDLTNPTLPRREPQT